MITRRVLPHEFPWLVMICVSGAAVLELPAPEYPPMAKQMHIGGVVALDVYIEIDGHVEKVEVVKGNPLLASSASAAVKKWKFTPFTVEGNPEKAIARMEFEFNP